MRRGLWIGIVGRPQDYRLAEISLNTTSQVHDSNTKNSGCCITNVTGLAASLPGASYPKLGWK